MGLDVVRGFRAYTTAGSGPVNFVRIDWTHSSANYVFLDLFVTETHPVGYVRMTAATRAQCLQAIVAAGLMCEKLVEELAQADRRFG